MGDKDQERNPLKAALAGWGDPTDGQAAPDPEPAAPAPEEPVEPKRKRAAKKRKRPDRPPGVTARTFDLPDTLMKDVEQIAWEERLHLVTVVQGALEAFVAADDRADVLERANRIRAERAGRG